MSTESFQNLVEIFFFFFMDTVTLPTPKKNGNLDKCSIMQGNLDHQGATEK